MSNQHIQPINKLELTEAQLSEMQQMAIRFGAPPSLSYSHTQQIITIKALELLLKSFGIDLPVSVDNIGGYHQRPTKQHSDKR